MMASKGRNIVEKETVQHKLERLRKVCNSAKNVCIIIYANPDPDALASALALKTTLETKKRAINIGYTGAVGRPENA